MVREQLPIVKLGDLLPQPYKNGIYKSADSYGEGTPILRITDFNNEGNLVTEELQCLFLESNEIANYKLESRDIVINRVNSLTHIGKAILWQSKDNSSTVYESNMMRIQPNESVILSEFLIRVLQSEPAREHFRKVAKRAVAQCSINQQDVKSLTFPLPPPPEQRKIAAVLSTWDKAISTTEQLLANSQQQKKALMQQLLTGKKRLLDENGDRFRGEWKDVRLKSLLHEEKTRNKKNNIERVLSVTNHSGFVLPEDQFSKRVASDDVSNYKVVKKGQYGYNPSRLNVGSFARLNSYDEGLLSPMYVVFSVNEKHLNSDYFLNWMYSNEAKQRIAGSTQGSVRDSVGFDALCGFPFKLPPLEEQQKIAAVLTAADKEISALKQKVEALKQEKKALMQQLLTGKRRVQVDEVAA